MKIGFVGLGNMGLPMAKNLKQAGHHLQVFDSSKQAQEAAQKLGMSICQSAAETANDADYIVTMLPNGPISLSVLNELKTTAKKGALIIDSSTIDVASAKQAHSIAQESGLGLVDAPVSGGIGGADAGSLTFMVGGNKASFEKAKPLLDIMGGKIVHCGHGGAGQSAKICNNMLLAVSMIGTCEAFSLAEKLGLSAQSAFDVMSTSSGFCWSINNYCPVPEVGPKSPADNDYTPGFATELMLKDLGLSQQAAEETGQATPMGQYATQLYQHFIENGGEGKDFSGIIEYLKNAKRS